LDEWQNCIEVNLMAPMILTRLCVPVMIQTQLAPGTQGSKAVLFTGSVSGTMAMPNMGAYCASKYGIRGFANCVFDDIREEGIKVCCFMPGFINTEMARGPDRDASKMIQTEDVCSACMHVILWQDTSCPVEMLIRPQRNAYKKSQ
jgi:short-subunit dehydrogenase